MFFERPQFFALLLLALPWIRWLRRQEPREFEVGGLGPFRAFARTGGTRRRGWPLALICALAALSCAVLALARPHFSSRSSYLLLDRSFSVRSCGVAAPAGLGREILESETDLLATLRGLPVLARVEVWTDLPAPAGLPSRIRWNDEAFRGFRGPNAAILVARPLSERRWAVHWLAEAGTGPLLLVSDANDRAPSDSPASAAESEGIAEIEVSAAATRLELCRPDGSAPDSRQDHSWILGAGTWVIPDNWDARWEAVASAARPGLQIRRALRVADPPFAADPVAALGDLDAVAFLAGQLREMDDRLQPPRPASECRAPLPSSPWMEPEQASEGSSAAATGWLGAVGAAFLLMSLLASMPASWRRRVARDGAG